MSQTAIPFLDLITPHQELRAELTEVFTRAMDTAGFIGGPNVQGFENDFAKFCNASHCVGVADGTTALRLAFEACGVLPGDLVLTTPHTFIATSEAITQVGATPIFIDIDEATYNIDPQLIRDFIARECRYDRAAKQLVHFRSGARVSTIVPVHLYGQMADMDAIMAIAEEFGLMVIEDACQAHGAEYYSERAKKWQRAGSIGKAAAFSFYPGKNLGACGEAGAVTTNDEGIAARIRMLRDHGQSKKYYHDIEGCNGRLDAMQAGFLQVKLRHLQTWTDQRRAAAAAYGKLFAEAGATLTLPYTPDWSRPVYHLYVIRVSNREEFMKELAEAGIGTGIHYPIPLHLQAAYRRLGHREGDFPVTERVAREIVSLPMFPQLQESQQRFVVERVMALLATSVAA